MLENILARIEAEDAENRVWIVGPEVGRLLNWLVRVFQPESIVEIGTSVGYSALWMAEALQRNGMGHLWTVESHKDRFAQAQGNIEASGLGAWITQIKHHAPEVFFDAEVELPECIDMAFFDATKKQHQQFYDAIRPRMKPGGLIVVDNVQTHREAFEGFIEFMLNNKELEVVELSAGTGVLLARLIETSHDGSSH